MEGDIVSLSGEAGTCGLNQVRSLKVFTTVLQKPLILLSANDHVFFIYINCVFFIYKYVYYICTMVSTSFYFPTNRYF
jgi:hypothetical protein